MTTATGRERTACPQSTKYLIEPLPAGTGGSQHEREHSLAVRLLSRLTGSEAAVLHHDSGAPYLAQHPGLHVSISHCRTAVAVAVSEEGPVGIDIESRRRIGEGLMERICTPEELAAIHRSDDPTMAFLRLWTQKEAVLKCRGTGIKGFGSMVSALEQSDLAVQQLPTGLPDTVASLATVRGEGPIGSRRG